MTPQNCGFTLTGLNSGDFIKVFDQNFNQVWTCNQFGGGTCSSTEVVSGLGTGTYFVQACNDLAPYNITCGGGGSNPCANQGGDSDGDGVCNNQDCQPLNPSLPASPGSTCNDFNQNTFNDRIGADGCSCAGTPTGGGGNNGGGGNVCSISTNSCSFTISGLSSNDIAKVFNENFQVVWSCSPFNGNPCNANEFPGGFGNGTYFIEACNRFDPFTLNGCGFSNIGNPNDSPDEQEHERIATLLDDPNSFVIYPNPAQDELNINLESINGIVSSIQIYDINAKLVKEQNVDAFASDRVSVDLSDVRNGLYLISVELSNNRRVNQAFTVVKSY